MIRKPKVYWDTSVISALFDKWNPDRQELTEIFFNSIENFEPFISEITMTEIEETNDVKLRKKLIEKAQKFTLLNITDDDEKLAKLYVQNGAIPENYSEDAFHIAIAVVNEMDYLLSWNFKHIVRLKTKEIVKMVNTLNNFRYLEILTPPELL